MIQKIKPFLSANLNPVESDPLVARRIMVALVPAMIMSMIFFGHNSLVIVSTSVVSCLVVNFLSTRLILKAKRPFWNNNTALTGVLLAFCLPPGLSPWLVISGAIVAVTTSMAAFGSLRNYRFHPALAGSFFLLLCFPAQMSSWTATITSIDTFSGATPLGLIATGIQKGRTISQILSDAQVPAYFDMFWGDVSGSIGEISAIAILIGGLYLLMKKIISWHIPFAVLGTMFMIEGILWMLAPGRFADPVFHMVTGGAMLGALFMATGPGMTPASSFGKLIFGAGVGLITILIRNFGPFPEGITIAILIMNGLTPLIDANTTPELSE